MLRRGRGVQAFTRGLSGFGESSFRDPHHSGPAAATALPKTLTTYKVPKAPPAYTSEFVPPAYGYQVGQKGGVLGVVQETRAPPPPSPTHTRVNQRPI